MIANFDTPRKTIPIEVVVDTGATYSLIPEDVLKRLRVKSVRTISVKIANGKMIHRKLGLALMTIRGQAMPTPVIFGDKGSEPLLGAVTMEEFGFTVDPIHRTLVPATAYLLTLF